MIEVAIMFGLLSSIAALTGRGSASYLMFSGLLLVLVEGALLNKSFGAEMGGALVFIIILYGFGSIWYELEDDTPPPGDTMDWR